MAKKGKSKQKSDQIRSGEAVRLLEPHFGRLAAKAMIADHLREGTIQAEAQQAWESSAADAWEEFSKGPSEDTYVSKRVLPPKVWCSTSSWLADVGQWRWKPGYFILTLKERPLKRLFLSRVRFNREDVLQLLPKKPKSNRGRPMRVEDWKLVGPALIRMALSGRFTPENIDPLEGYDRATPFDGIGDITNEICLEIGERLSESSIGPIASQIWREFLDSQKFDS